MTPIVSPLTCTHRLRIMCSIGAYIRAPPTMETMMRPTTHLAPPPRRLYRVPDAMAALGIRRSALYQRIAAGLMPPPAHVGRVSVWASDEVEAIQRAILSGATDDELREIVRGLVRGRAGAMPATDAA
jgi:prophage regulatory protein